MKINPFSAELKELIAQFFEAVSFEEGQHPNYDRIYRLFIERGLLIKNSADRPEISTVVEFIEPREAIVRSGELTQFHESELSEITEVFGNVAHRFSTYTKSGTMNGVLFEARGVITTQFIQTPEGWRISSMAWDDERAGLSVPDRYKTNSLIR
jgi:hypothetical protein